VASPFPPAVPRDADELIRPARDGALRVLRAAREAGVRRVVLTSSFAAVGYGGAGRTAPYTEADWTDASGADVQPYVKSKTIAERAAWDFIASEGGALELSVINPVGVFGPVLGPDFSTSILMAQRLLNGDFPGLPRLWFGVVDVRDVADLHIRAMTDPAASGERFLAVAGDFVSMMDMARMLKAELGAAGARIPSRELPDWLVRLVALLDPSARQLLPELGKQKNATAEKAIRQLGWSPRSSAEAVVATAKSLIDLGLLRGSVRAPASAAAA
jgi:nucleoside-diphosphate-sugar epimerase